MIAIKIICAGCGKEREGLLHRLQSGEIVFFLEAICPHCRERGKYESVQSGPESNQNS